jgi:transposase
MPLRGNYKKYNEHLKQRILREAESGGDWINLAEANEVPYKTAYNWLTSGCQKYKKRGGARSKKIMEQHINSVLMWLQEDCQLTLMELCNRLEVQHDVTVSQQALSKHLDGRLFTTKKVHYMPHGINTEVNKQLRCEYVRDMMEYETLGKIPIFLDETNFNLFCRRSIGRSPRGKRAVVKMPNSKGPNLHIIGGMSATGDFYWERRRGAFLKEACMEWVRRCLEYYIIKGLTPDQIVFVFDNAPVHSGLENMLQEPLFAGVNMLRLAPYSAMLNPIEHVWSEVKTRLSEYMRQHLAISLEGYDNLTLSESRLRILENAADQAMTGVSAEKCRNVCDHVQDMYPRALDMEDMLVGV